MFYDSDDFISCYICKERFEKTRQRCPNCSARINRNNINVNRLRIRNINNIPIEINSKTNIKLISNPKKEIEIRKMNYELFNKENGVLEEQICGICLEKIKYDQYIYLLLFCKHFFHIYCAKKWFQVKSECPFCRKKVNNIFE